MIKKQTLRGHKGAVLAVRWNHTGKYCLSGGDDRSILLWNPYNGKLVNRYRGHNYEVLSIDVTQDSSKMASCGGDKQPLLWDVTTGNVLRRFRGHDNKVNEIVFNEEETILVTGSVDRSVRIWDCKSRSIDPIQILPEAQDAINSIALDQPYIVSGSMDGSVRTYDVRKGIMTSDYVGPPVLSVSLSHDHNCTLVSTLDNTLRLFDRNTGELLNEYKGHLNKLYKVQSRFTYSDEKVVSGSEDGGVFVWDLVESGKMEVLKSHTMTSCCVDCHPRETTIISGSVDGTIVLWQSP